MPKRFVILLDDDDAKRLEDYCEREGDGIFGFRQEILRRAVRQYLKDFINEEEPAIA
jgi:metal-responsive CopG/Arc/MetJ family transcriptional regulator